MPITAAHRTAFKTIQDAFASGKVVLKECRLRSTGETLAVICVTYELRPLDSLFIPMAMLFNGDPHDRVKPLPED